MTLLFPDKLVEGFKRVCDSHKPAALWLAGVESGRHEVLERLEEKQIVVFPSPEKAIRALSVLHRLSRSKLS
jgi:acyl-CoA synthetase (NDP forming)